MFKDFGFDVLISSVEQSNFPWFISNIINEETKIPLGNDSNKTIISLNGLKVFMIAFF